MAFFRFCQSGQRRGKSRLSRYVEILFIITGAQLGWGTGLKNADGFVFSTLHCEGYIADLRYIVGSLLLGVLAG